jgi:uncharacterized membrane protein
VSQPAAGGGRHASATACGRSLAAAGLIGVGLMAAIDEIVFHQILAWHHFYDRSTSDVALLSDGLLHAGELIVLVLGFFLFADLRRQHAVAPACARAGLFLGLGGFQLFDGLIDHKALRLHHVRYGVDLLPYDVAWNLAGLALLLVGAVLGAEARHRAGGTKA